MDASVLNAMARWPNVPAAYGWLSLDARGVWRLHPGGDGARGAPGESISSPQIIAFIGRNYARDDAGNWYFQNGPQRVFVRLDAAPFVLRLAEAASGFETHTGLAVAAVSRWLVDDEGRLFAQTEHGAAVVDDRELGAILDYLRTERNLPLLDALDDGPDTPVTVAPRDGALPAAPLQSVPAADIPGQLGFVRNPVAPGPTKTD